MANLEVIALDETIPQLRAPGAGDGYLLNRDVTLNTSNLSLDATTNANQKGIITKDGTRFIHNFNYGNNGTVTTEGNNTCIGKNAGNLTMGSTATQTYHASYNTFSGEQAGYYNTTGYHNTFVGSVAGYNNTTGYDNTFAGMSAGYYNTTGYHNTFAGMNAGLNSGKTVTAGSFVVGVSYTIITTGTTDFTAIGAADSNPGTVFTATGVGTGTGTAASNTHQNTFTGAYAGYDVLTGGDNSIFGYNTGRGIETGTGNSILGAGVTGLAAGLTNNIILASGNTARATFDGTHWSFTGTVKTAGYTVATLPAAGTAGRRAYVTDATAPTFLGTLTGGGAVVCPVFDNGAAWVAG